MLTYLLLAYNKQTSFALKERYFEKNAYYVTVHCMCGEIRSKCHFQPMIYFYNSSKKFFIWFFLNIAALKNAYFYRTTASY